MDATAQRTEHSTESTEHISTVGTLRRIGETVLSTVHNRLELLTLELKEEKYWLVSALMFAAFAIVFGILTVVAIFVTVAFLTPENARPWVLIGLCVVCIGALLFSIFRLKSKLKRPAPLTDTLAEIKKDIECLKT